jgi:hypothetical protein
MTATLFWGWMNMRWATQGCCSGPKKATRQTVVMPTLAPASFPDARHLVHALDSRGPSRQRDLAVLEIDDLFCM